jgi:spore coat polysaccharide biosynthesis predicted glycosyltransferase SpsG
MVSETKDWAGDMIDFFEEFLYDKNIDISNKERDKALSEGEDISILYGADYYVLEDELTAYIRQRMEKVRQDLILICEDNINMQVEINKYFEELNIGDLGEED